MNYWIEIRKYYYEIINEKNGNKREEDYFVNLVLFIYL